MKRKGKKLISLILSNIFDELWKVYSYMNYTNVYIMCIIIKQMWTSEYTKFGNKTIKHWNATVLMLPYSWWWVKFLLSFNVWHLITPILRYLNHNITHRAYPSVTIQACQQNNMWPRRLGVTSQKPVIWYKTNHMNIKRSRCPFYSHCWLCFDKL